MVLINSFKYPESNIRFTQRNVRVILDKKDLGVGTLYYSELAKEGDFGFSVSYTDISLHAISKDENVYPKECLYVILDGHITMPGDSSHQDDEYNENNDSNDSTGSTADMSEMLLVPEENAITDSVAVKSIYENMKVCQELNPDPLDMSDEDDHLYEDAEDEMDEGEYEVQERGGGDADIDDLSRRIQGNSVDIRYNCANGNDDEEFQDAD